MTVQLAISTRNARLDAIEADTGTSAILKLRTGAVPANCAAADSGTVLATINLAADWMSAAASGSKSMSGLPVTDNSADATGTAGHFRIYKSDGTTCTLQGTAGQGTGDLSLDNTSLVSGQQFAITGFTLTDGNS